MVNIPIALYSATKQKSTVDLDLLRDSDFSRIRYKKVSEADGKEVPKEHLVKGYEYEKGKYVALKDEDFERVQIKSNQTHRLLCHSADLSAAIRAMVQDSPDAVSGFFNAFPARKVPKK